MRPISPRPWTRRETIDGIEILDAAGDLVCEIRRAPRKETTDQDRANFALIVHAVNEVDGGERCMLCGDQGGDPMDPTSLPCPLCGKERG